MTTLSSDVSLFPCESISLSQLAKLVVSKLEPAKFLFAKLALSKLLLTELALANLPLAKLLLTKLAPAKVVSFIHSLIHLVSMTKQKC
jgi:hypothetical protein